MSWLEPRYIFTFFLGAFLISPLFVLFILIILFRFRYFSSFSKLSTKNGPNEAVPEKHVPWVNSQVGWIQISFLGKTTVEPNKPGSCPNLFENSSTPRRSKESWFAVLISDTLRLYDNEKCLACRITIRLKDYCSILTPSGLTDDELFKKDHPIRLQARYPEIESYLIYISSSCEKEGWYTSLVIGCQLENALRQVNPLHLDKLGLRQLINFIHSKSDTTHWFNAIAGRLFLSVHKQSSFNDKIVQKLLTILNKAPRPHFISKFRVSKLQVGSGLPKLSNSNLNGLSVSGEFDFEADVSYNGGVRLIISTEINSPFSFLSFKIPISAQVTLHDLYGRLKIVVNKPPSNRIWLSFVKLPSWNLDIHPVIMDIPFSNWLICKTLNRVVQEAFFKNLVFPRMEDICFLPSPGLGGIFDLITDETEPDLISDTSSAVSYSETISTTLLDARDTISEISIQIEETKFDPPSPRRPRSSSQSQSRSASPTSQSSGTSTFNDFMRQLKTNVFNNKKPKSKDMLSPYSGSPASLSMPNLFFSASEGEDPGVDTPSSSPSPKLPPSFLSSPKLTPSLKSKRSFSPKPSSPKAFLPSIDMIRSTFSFNPSTKKKSKKPKAHSALPSRANSPPPSIFIN